jgi:uncharacterized protein YecT (DUF1311 family)
MPDLLRGRAHPIRTLLLLSTLLVAATTEASSTAYPNLSNARGEAAPGAHWLRQCQQVRYLRPPPQDLPRARSAGHCDARDLYARTAGKSAPGDADWQAVRECAFRTGDNAVLMKLYASGEGVAPNLGLAMKYACSTPGTAPEMKTRLVRLTTQPALRSAPCTEAGGKSTRCLGTHSDHAGGVQDGDIMALAQTWAPKEKTGLEMALEAARHFAEHRRDYETDIGSVARARLQAESEAAELERFASDVDEFEGGKLPRYTPAEFNALEEKMNQVYQQFMQNAPGPDSYLGAIRKNGVEKTQRVWLAYRDAMELFGSIRHPKVPASGWRALLTSRRLRQLTELNNAQLGR